MIVEIVAQSLEDALCAARAGADRLELVSALALGGLTPSGGTLDAVLSECKLPIVAMLRPRSGGFAYAPGELAAMDRDAETFVAKGVQGLVFGVLNDQGEIDMKANARLLGKGGDGVFHRAFDALDHPFDSLERLIDLGFRRVLTSGGQGDALKGADTIRRLVEQADGRIEILPGGGVRSYNAVEIVRRTGVTQVHLAGQVWAQDRSTVNSNVAFNGPSHPEDRYGRVEESTVSAVVRAVAALSTSVRQTF